ncbi:DUF4304 domain-containing protein [Bacillus sp. FJAT-26390]|uniref:DUF4304 domain-containing protein n=1 Tax=Bacillus sp. FJAT-26390 TaxID=1743142 RepID=UPI000807E449|nr:DUF4304 domain-containing protein [Bacillus sp. FJAT-26390]OBZ12802.1 hypothetical protein A7975_17620 [Bacillus sp. FJAT-26390]
MIDLKKFKRLLKETFEQELIKYGFNGTGGKYRTKPNNHFIYTVNIQADKYGGSCCVELGVYIDFIPNPSGVHVPLNKVSSYDCDFRWRLSDLEDEDLWWSYGETEIEALENIGHMTEIFVEYGLRYFEYFINFPESLTSTSIEDIEQSNKNVKRWGELPTDIRLALVISRVHLYVNNSEQAIYFAIWAINQIGNKLAGSALIPVFNEIINEATAAKSLQ